MPFLAFCLGDAAREEINGCIDSKVLLLLSPNIRHVRTTRKTYKYGTTPVHLAVATFLNYEDGATSLSSPWSAAGGYTVVQIEEVNPCLKPEVSLNFVTYFCNQLITL